MHGTVHPGGVPSKPNSTPQDARSSARKTVGILQSNYLPWKGYFDLIERVDEFIFHDDLQYTKGDWRNRNRVKTETGSHWLTIPCGIDEKRKICEVELEDDRWQRRHWQRIYQYYRAARHFRLYSDFFFDFYTGHRWTNLSELNQHLITSIARDALEIETRFLDSRCYDLQLKKGPRVLELLRKVDADVYLSGPAAKNYLDADDFESSGIELRWMTYGTYPKYPQFGSPFEHRVSILDLLFHCGPESKRFFRAND